MKLGMRSDSKGRTPFEQKWGMHVKELAKQECVGPEAIYMRVRNYGTPFQRHPKPSVEEIMFYWLWAAGGNLCSSLFGWIKGWGRN